MQLTDQEVVEIILREKKRKRRRKRIIKRVSLLVLSLIIITVAAVVVIKNLSHVEPRGIIFIDPGHGGVDSGSYVGDRMEKNDTLSLSLKVKEELEALNFTVCMSRSTDQFVELQERADNANSQKAQLFISIHRNKAVEGNGVEVYIPSKNDNTSQLLGNSIFTALVDQGYMARSVRVGTLQTEDDDYAENGLTNMPSCLVEIGFLQDKKDNEIFDTKMEESAIAIANAISETFETVFEPESIE